MPVSDSLGPRWAALQSRSPDAVLSRRCATRSAGLRTASRRALALASPVGGRRWRDFRFTVRVRPHRYGPQTAIIPGVLRHALAPVCPGRRGRVGAAAHDGSRRARGGADVRRRSASRGHPGDPRGARASRREGDVLRRRRAGRSAGRRCVARDRGPGPPGRAARLPPPAAAARSSATAVLDDLERGRGGDRGRDRRAADAGTGRRTGSTALPGCDAARARGLQPLLWSRWGKDWRTVHHAGADRAPGHRADCCPAT